jgi:hypothetical protein
MAYQVYIPFNIFATIVGGLYSAQRCLFSCVLRAELDTHSTANWTLISLQTGQFEAA